MIVEAATGDHIGGLFTDPEGVSAVGLTGDGTRVAVVTSSSLGLTRWNLDAATWIDAACAVAGRNLTLQEWEQNMGDAEYRATCPERPLP